jgi:hypothetical protein
MRRLKSAAVGLTNLEILEIITLGTDKVLGKGTSLILFETLRRIYHLDASSIPSHLDQFETHIQKMMGEKISKDVISGIIEDQDLQEKRR